MPGLGAYALAGGLTGAGTGLVEFQRNKQREAEMLLKRQWQQEDMMQQREWQLEDRKARGSGGGRGGGGGSPIKPMSSAARKEIEERITELEDGGLTRDQAMTRLSNDPLYAPLFQQHLPSVFDGRDEPTPMLDAPDAPSGQGSEKATRGGFLGALRFGGGGAKDLDGSDLPDTPGLDVDPVYDALPQQRRVRGLENPELGTDTPPPPAGLETAKPIDAGPKVQPDAPEQPATVKTLPAGYTKDSVLEEARKALAQGKSRRHIEQMLIDWGIDPGEL